MFNPEKISKEIIETFNSLNEDEQKRILSNCGLSFQKKQKVSTNNVLVSQHSTRRLQKTSASKVIDRENELVKC